MNEGNASSAVLTPEQELLVEGCKSYLNVLHAINAYQTRVCHTARDVINAACDRIAQCAKLKKPLGALADVYVYPAAADSTFTGIEAWLGATLWLDDPVWARLHLALVFDDDSHSGQRTAQVCLALQAHQKWVVKQLGDLFREYPDCQVFNDDWDWLAVELRRPLEDPLHMRQELETLLDSALTWWSKGP